MHGLDFELQVQFFAFQNQYKFMNIQAISSSPEFVTLRATFA